MSLLNVSFRESFMNELREGGNFEKKMIATKLDLTSAEDMIAEKQEALAELRAKTRKNFA